MFFVLPTAAIFAIYILAAVLPAIFLLRYIYKHDTVDKEPPGLLLSLILMGIVAALMSIVLEIIGEKLRRLRLAGLRRVRKYKICYELRSVRCAPARGARRSRSYGIRSLYGSVLRARQALLRPRLQGQKGDESPRLLSLRRVPARVL